MSNPTVQLPLSDLVNSMNESSTIRMSAMARELAAKGHEVISLSLGEPDFDTPDHIKEAAKIALDQGFTKYTPVSGLPELKAAIVEKIARDNNIKAKASQVVVSNGAKQSIANVCLAMLNPGDEVIILTPYWVSYVEIVRMTGAVPIFVSAGIEEDFKPTAMAIEAAITDKTKLMIYSSPCNPTGSVFTHDEMESMANMLARYPQVYIMADEIYEYINFTGKHVSMGSFTQVAERVITINGFAKGFSMTGWRLGYLIAPEWLAKACDKIQGQFTSGANSFSQKAAAVALLADLSPTYAMKDAFNKRRALVVELLGKVPGLKINNPQGAFYIFPDVSYYFGKSDGSETIRDADQLAEYLLNKAYVATVSGTGFGDDQCIRLSYAASEDQLKEAIRRIAAALSELK